MNDKINNKICLTKNIYFIMNTGKILKAEHIQDYKTINNITKINMKNQIDCETINQNGNNYNNINNDELTKVQNTIVNVWRYRKEGFIAGIISGIIINILSK